MEVQEHFKQFYVIYVYFLLSQPNSFLSALATISICHQFHTSTNFNFHECPFSKTKIRVNGNSKKSKWGQMVIPKNSN